MTYDITLAPISIFKNGDEVSRAAAPPNGTKEELKRLEKMVKLLSAVNPQLRIVRISEEVVQVTSVQSGIEIMLFASRANVSVAYDAKREQVRRAFRELWNYLEIVERETGWVAFDAQLGEVLEVSRGFESALTAYISRGTPMADPSGEGTPTVAVAKPWWKIW